MHEAKEEIIWRKTTETTTTTPTHTQRTTIEINEKHNSYLKTELSETAICIGYIYAKMLDSFIYLEVFIYLFFSFSWHYIINIINCWPRNVTEIIITT